MTEAAEKKKRQWGKGGGHEASKRAKFDSGVGGAYTSLSALRKGQAILITCDVGRERRAAKELQVILEQWAEEGDNLDPEGDHDDGEGATETAATTSSIKDSLQQEIAELKGKKAEGGKKHIIPIDTGTKGTAGVSLPKECGVKPMDACLRLLEEAKAGHSRSRCICKLMPMERLCYGKLETMTEVLTDLFNEKFPELVDKRAEHIENKESYMISLQRRCYENQSREEIFKALGEAVQGRLRVDLKHPDHVILVEAIKGTLGMSIIKDKKFTEFNKFNLRNVQDEARAGGKQPKDNKQRDNDEQKEEEAEAVATVAEEPEEDGN